MISNYAISVQLSSVSKQNLIHFLLVFSRDLYDFFPLIGIVEDLTFVLLSNICSAY